jgi:NADH-quinone oxidoreductase subunit D
MPSESTKDLESVDIMVNMGPQHPSTHGVFRMVLWIDGERVVELEPHIGYLHRGSEKISEGEIYPQVVTLFDRLDYLSNLNNEMAFCLAVEKLMEIEIPKRADYVRMILCELNRISSHMLFYGTMGLDAGAMTPIMYGFRERERIQEFFQSVTGARMMHNYIQIGGLREEPPKNFQKQLKEMLPLISKSIEECDQLLTLNEVFLSRSRDIGIISGNEALELGLSGPSLRASGIAEDIRFTEPYSSYDEVDFNLPVGVTGDTWDRYVIRIAEMRESIKIIEQTLALLPDNGATKASGIRLIPRPPKGESYVRVENPRGDLGVYIVSDGGDKPYRVKIRAPSFANLQALRKMSVGSYVADVVMILGSLDIVLGEVDR